MKDFLLEIICLVICAASLILRKRFVDLHDIEIFMLVVNGLALWISVILVFEKARINYRDRLKDAERDYKTSKSYKKLIKVSILLSIVLSFADVYIMYRIESVSDYITILTLGIALADDFLAKVFCSFFKYK